MELLDTLRTRIIALLKKHSALAEEHERLKVRARAQEQRIEELERMLRAAEKQQQLEQLAHAIKDPAQRKKLRAQLDGAIREIDNMIKSLNQHA